MDSHRGGIRRSLPRMEGAGERVMGGSMVGSTLLGNEEGYPSWSEGTVCATRMEVVFVKQENCIVPCGSKGWPWAWLPSQ